MPGVKEDVTDLILNVKQLVVSSEHDEPVVMYLRKQGPGDVTAADIAPPAGVEVHNPDLHIATLNGKGRLDMELTVERGRGYVSATQNKPATRRSAGSRSTRSTRRCCASRTRSRPPGSSSEPTSTGSSSRSRPSTRCAARRAGQRRQDAGRAVRSRPRAQPRGRGHRHRPVAGRRALAADLALPIEYLELTVRSYNCLKREGIHSVGELVARSEPDLMDIRNFGRSRSTR